MNLIVFKRHNLGTVNAELIKTEHWLVEIVGCYTLYRRKRGQPLGKIERGFPDKKSAYKQASEIMNSYHKLNID